MDEPQIPPEHFPPDWVFDEGYRLDAYHVPVKGEEIWSPHLQQIVTANGEETHPRVALVFVGQEATTAVTAGDGGGPAPPWPELEPEPECDHDHCDQCGAPLEDEPPPELANILPFPKEVWKP